MFFFSDEAWFQLDGYINTQNFHISFENPHIFQRMSLHPQKIGVLCTTSRKHILRPIFHKTTITAEIYHYVIHQFIALLHKDKCDAIFQQDNARLHVAKYTISFSAEFFGKRISKWLPHGSDLSPLNFFLWSYLKNIGYRDAPQSIAELKNKTEDAIREIDATTCWTVFANLLKSTSSCLANKGGHFKHLWLVLPTKLI